MCTHRCACVAYAAFVVTHIHVTMSNTLHSFSGCIIMSLHGDAAFTAAYTANTYEYIKQPFENSNLIFIRNGV